MSQTLRGESHAANYFCPVDTVYFRSRQFPASTQRFAVLQDYIARPLIGFVAVYGVMLAYLLARHLPVLMPGLVGGFAVILLSNFFGQTRARASFLEIGFSGDFFYMRSAYDIAHDANLKYYPLAYANAARDGSTIMLNYIDRPVRLRAEEWGEAMHDIWMKLNGF